MAIDFLEGDEFVFSRRRKIQVLDPETKEVTERTEILEISSIRCPTKCSIGGPGGSCEPIFEANPNNEMKDRRFLMVKLPMRY